MAAGRIAISLLNGGFMVHGSQPGFKQRTLHKKRRRHTSRQSGTYYERLHRFHLCS
jgi:hypothetical protein